MPSLTFSQRYVFNVDQIAGEPLNELVARARAVYRTKTPGARFSASPVIAMLLEVFKKANITDEEMFKLLYGHIIKSKKWRFDRTDRRNAERTERNKHKKRGEHARPTKGSRRLRKEVFKNDEEWEAHQLPVIYEPPPEPYTGPDLRAAADESERAYQAKLRQLDQELQERKAEAARKNEQILGGEDVNGEAESRTSQESES